MTRNYMQPDYLEVIRQTDGVVRQVPRPFQCPDGQTRLAYLTPLEWENFDYMLKLHWVSLPLEKIVAVCFEEAAMAGWGDDLNSGFAAQFDHSFRLLLAFLREQPEKGHANDNWYAAPGLLGIHSLVAQIQGRWVPYDL